MATTDHPDPFGPDEPDALRTFPRQALSRHRLIQLVLRVISALLILVSGLGLLSAFNSGLAWFSNVAARTEQQIVGGKPEWLIADGLDFGIRLMAALAGCFFALGLLIFAKLSEIARKLPSNR